MKKRKDWQGGVESLPEKREQREKSKCSKLLRIGIVSGSVGINESIGRGLREEQVWEAFEKLQSRSDIQPSRRMDIAFGLGRALVGSIPNPNSRARTIVGLGWLDFFEAHTESQDESDRVFESRLAFLAGRCAASGKLVNDARLGAWLDQWIKSADSTRLIRALACGASVWAPLAGGLHPLEVAYKAGRRENAEILLMRGAHPKGRRWREHAVEREERPGPGAGGYWSPFKDFSEAMRASHLGPRFALLSGEIDLVTRGLNGFGPNSSGRSLAPSGQVRWNEEKAADFAKELADTERAFSTVEEAWGAFVANSAPKIRAWAESGALKSVTTPGEASQRVSKRI